MCVLLFPTGQLWCYPYILYATVEEGGAQDNSKCKYVFMAEYNHYCLFVLSPHLPHWQSLPGVCL
jgi:hypothetical protein